MSGCVGHFLNPVRQLIVQENIQLATGSRRRLFLDLVVSIDLRVLFSEIGIELVTVYLRSFLKFSPHLVFAVSRRYWESEYSKGLSSSVGNSSVFRAIFR